MIIRKRNKKVDSGQIEEDLLFDNQIKVKKDLKYNDIKDDDVKDHIRKYLVIDDYDYKIEEELYVISHEDSVYLIDRRDDEYKICKIIDIPYHEFTKKN